MISEQTEIYEVGRGFVNPSALTSGSLVYTLDLNRVPGVTPVTDLTSEYLSGKINCIDSGAHNVDVTDDARLFYISERHGSALISWNQIPEMTPNKEYKEHLYLPVLSWPDQNAMQCSVDELEYIARSCAVFSYDRDSFRSVFDRCTGQDAIVLIDMLEFWLSESPGDGWFDRASVKSRSHEIRDRWVLDELCRISVLAGYTSATTQFSEFRYGLKVSYESMPIPGSRPKNQKYFKKYFTGNVYNINAGNLPILGRSRNRCFYLPTSSILNL